MYRLHLPPCLSDTKDICPFLHENLLTNRPKVTLGQFPNVQASYKPYSVLLTNAHLGFTT